MQVLRSIVLGRSDKRSPRLSIAEVTVKLHV